MRGLNMGTYWSEYGDVLNMGTYLFFSNATLNRSVPINPIDLSPLIHKIDLSPLILLPDQVKGQAEKYKATHQLPQSQDRALHKAVTDH
jgi:hypothetical protein